MIDEKEFKKLKQRAEDARAARDRAAGQLEGAMARLQEEFGCGTLKEAEKKAKQLSREADAAEASYNEAMTDFEERWGEYAGED